jgi:hypothetical protein
VYETGAGGRGEGASPKASGSCSVWPRKARAWWRGSVRGPDVEITVAPHVGAGRVAQRSAALWSFGALDVALNVLTNPV